MSVVTEGTGLGRIDVFSRVVVDAPRPAVFAALCALGEWYPHLTRAGSTAILEAQVGGRFYEAWEGGGGALHGEVSVLAPNERLSLRGPMGIRGAVTSVWTMELADAPGGGTRVHGSHRAFGDIDEDVSAGYSDGWGEIFGALRGYLGVSPNTDAPTP